jgi:hypothetical protein
MKRRIVRIGLLSLLAIALVVGAVAMTSSNYHLKWFTPGTGGGGGPVASSNYAVNFTVGQTVIGQASSSNYKTDLGYWYGLLRMFRRFLPIVTENKTY